jgi:O-antigen/teichoic acid export membrane protein
MGVGLWVNNAAEAAMQRMDKWFVGSTGGAEVLGLYNRAFTFSPVSHFAFNSLLTNPAISEMARRSSEDRKRYLLKTFLSTSGGGIVTMVFWLLLADPLVVWIFGAPWKGAIPYFKAMSALALCYAVLYVPVTFLFSLRHYTIAGIVRLAGVVALLCFLLMSQGHVSALGVSYVLQATLLAMGLVMWGAVAILSGRRYRPEGMNASEKSTECHG